MGQQFIISWTMKIMMEKQKMTPKENMLRILNHNSPQWVPNGTEGIVQIGSPVVERTGQTGYDAFNVHWTYEPEAEGGTYPTADGHPIKDIHKWREQISIPDISKIDWSGIKAHAETIDRDVYLVRGFVEMGLFERSYLLLGMDESLMAYVTEPEEMWNIIEAVADYKIALIEKFHEAANLDIIWYGDDWGTQSKLFLPPNTWRSIIGAHTQRIYDCMKERGIMVWQHSCGNIESVFGDMVKMGAQVWCPCQPCNDLADLKRKYGGKIAFSGGIDSQFILHRPGVTPDEVRVEVRRRIDEMAAGGGYIAGPSHGVPYDPEIIAAMNDEINTYGREYYK